MKYLRNRIGLLTLLIGLIFYFVLGCTNNRSIGNHISTIKITEGLYREKYKQFSGGVFAGDLYSDYLTDSLTFRKFIGTHDDEQNYGYRFSWDTIVVLKVSYKISNHIEIIDSFFLNLKALKKEGKFDF